MSWFFTGTDCTSYIKSGTCHSACVADGRLHHDTLSGAFKIYDQNLSLTGGGPGGTTKMIAMDIVDTAFAMNTMGLAQAKAVIFFIIVAILSLTQVYYNKKKEVEL